MIDLADSKLDDRVVQHLFKDPESDGGQWSMVSNLVEKYGLVPQCGERKKTNNAFCAATDDVCVQFIPNRSARRQPVD